MWNGIGSGMGNLWRLADAESRSISPENLAGEPGAGGAATDGTGSGPSRELGKGWKVSPSIVIPAGTTVTLADIAGPGAIQQIWMTQTGLWRDHIIRFHWDDQEHPSVECPVGDFFACGWNRYAQVSSLAVCVNPGSAFTCYWQMPFKQRARVTMTNRGEKDSLLYYQINYTVAEVGPDVAYFHAQFNRSNPLPYKQDHVILDGVTGRGQYVGTYIAWGVNNNGWWGEGEIKFYMDDDSVFPTICGTGTEDYFCGSYNFDVGKENGGYREFTTPYAGLPQVIRPDGLYDSQQRFGMYRWHVTDPIRFRKKLRVSIQALGWKSGGRYLPLQDDISSVAYWYQTLPSNPPPSLPSRDYLEIV